MALNWVNTNRTSRQTIIGQTLRKFLQLLSHTIKKYNSHMILLWLVKFIILNFQKSNSIQVYYYIQHFSHFIVISRENCLPRPGLEPSTSCFPRKLQNQLFLPFFKVLHFVNLTWYHSKPSRKEKNIIHVTNKITIKR